MREREQPLRGSVKPLLTILSMGHLGLGYITKQPARHGLVSPRPVFALLYSDVALCKPLSSMHLCN